MFASDAIAWRLTPSKPDRCPEIPANSLKKGFMVNGVLNRLEEILRSF